MIVEGNMNQVIMKQTSALPMIILRGLVVFPNTLLHFDMARKKSILALENAMLNQQLAFVTAQKDASVEHPTPKDIEKMGTICRITQVVKMPNNTVRVLVEGIKRAEISEILNFPSQNHFTEAFKRQCGLTPSEHRRRLIKADLNK